MKNKLILILSGLLVFACGSPDVGGNEPREDTTYTYDGDALTVEYWMFPSSDVGTDKEALTITSSEGSTGGFHNDTQDFQVCPANLASPGECVYPRDKILAYFNGIPASVDQETQVNWHDRWAETYAQAAVTFGGSGAWTLATNTAPHTGGDEMYLRYTVCPNGCIAHTIVTFETSSGCSTRNGTKYCPQKAATGCYTEVYADAAASNMARNLVTTQAHRDTYARNVFRHELGHCLGLPHLNNSPTDIMYPTEFSFNDLAYSALEVSAIRNLVP